MSVGENDSTELDDDGELELVSCANVELDDDDCDDGDDELLNEVLELLLCELVELDDD